MFAAPCAECVRIYQYVNVYSLQYWKIPTTNGGANCKTRHLGWWFHRIHNINEVGVVEVYELVCYSLLWHAAVIFIYYTALAHRVLMKRISYV